MKCSGKKLVEYLHFVEKHNAPRVYVELRSKYRKEHEVAVTEGYIKKVTIQDTRARAILHTWELTPDGAAFLRQLRGDFQPSRATRLERQVAETRRIIIDNSMKEDDGWCT